MERQISIRENHRKTSLTLFRVLFVILLLGLLGGGISQLFRIEYQVDQFSRLGYPMYLLSIIGIAKILGALVLILHKWPLLTVGAYVGSFIVSVCAFLSHLVSGDPLLLIINPLILTTITVACCHLDPTIRFAKG